MSTISTYNPLIGETTKDTLYHVRCSMYALEELARFAIKKGKIELTDDGQKGLYYLFCCVSEAMRYEYERNT